MYSKEQVPGDNLASGKDTFEDTFGGKLGQTKRYMVVFVELLSKLKTKQNQEMIIIEYSKLAINLDAILVLAC